CQQIRPAGSARRPLAARCKRPRESANGASGIVPSQAGNSVAAKASGRIGDPASVRGGNAPYTSSSTNGVPSKHSSPRPISAIASVIRPLRSSAASASATRRALGGAEGAGDVEFVARRIQRAGGDEGGGGRAADAGEAMDQHRLGAIPAAHEVDEVVDMRALRQR